MFDWNDLRYFLAVARAGSTLAAGRSLGVNQSTVHRRLHELERQLGCQLVRRHPTGYRLTELGEQIRGFAERVEGSVADFERRVAAAGKDLRGTIKVTCPEALGARLIGSRLIEEFHARYPALRVEFVMSDKILNLASGDADVALRAKAPTDNALVGRAIGDSPWAIYASRAYVKRHEPVKRREDIAGHSVVMFAGELRDHHAVRWFKAVAPNAHVAARGNSLPSLLLAAKSGAGLAALPMIVGENEDGLVRVLGPIPELATPFYMLVHRDMRRTPRVRAFLDFVVEHLPAIRPLLSGAPQSRRAVKTARRRKVPRR